MATLSMNQAAKLFKKSRNTLQRMVKSGEISANENGIEFSELLRVFGEPESNTEQPREQVRATHENQAQSRESNPEQLREQPGATQKDIELAVLKERIAGLQNVIEEKDKLLSEREKLVLLLAHKNEEPTIPKVETIGEKETKSTIWHKLFYKDK